MAKKDKKKKDKQKGSDATVAVEAVRSAVERTFHAAGEGASRVREAIEELRILDEVRGLRAEIEGLARRVAALEIRDGAPTRPAPAKRTTTTRRPAKRAATRTTAKRATAKAKPAASKTRAKTRAKPRAKTARAKPAGGSSS
jgi:hypothetical protein